ncbi:DUF6603 domain-containing protein [Nonomuraea sp. NPDC059007]|uniref:DUF6603 domain-containing protein n=1 Tax=Nonomuraea sp. NPDC059007 TaxID=3346692 RepID=UPI00369E9206
MSQPPKHRPPPWGPLPRPNRSADLALILSLRDPKVILLGRMRMAVPSPQLPLIDLCAEVYGEFSGDRVLVIATLTGSRFGFFGVSGEVGVLLRFGDGASFALVAGGFHPRYAPPAELAGLRRLTAGFVDSVPAAYSGGTRGWSWCVGRCRASAVPRPSDGSYELWTTRRVSVGRGEGRSGLAFDSAVR